MFFDSVHEVIDWCVTVPLSAFPFVQVGTSQGSNFKCSAAAIDPLVEDVLLALVVALPGYILEGQGWGSCGFSQPGTFKKRFHGKKMTSNVIIRCEIVDILF